MVISLKTDRQTDRETEKAKKQETKKNRIKGHGKNTCDQNRRFWFFRLIKKPES